MFCNPVIVVLPWVRCLPSQEDYLVRGVVCSRGLDDIVWNHPSQRGRCVVSPWVRCLASQELAQGLLPTDLEGMTSDGPMIDYAWALRFQR